MAFLRSVFHSIVGLCTVFAALFNEMLVCHPRHEVGEVPLDDRELQRAAGADIHLLTKDIQPLCQGHAIGEAGEAQRELQDAESI